uniref:non-specific lipid transfer protein GPI-anchored 2-like n=1 Tax=Fragaria vesca subsp. vesca TaxID=101020 RepID=UPI0005C8E9FB|nr:PREDICTED: non-specific lipid transfer protein GPI-anchored 2-like [Fragaria vesca subsp. vesca]
MLNYLSHSRNVKWKKTLILTPFRTQKNIADFLHQVKSIIKKINEKMTRIVFLLFILATWTALANCARPHVQPLNPETDEMRSSTAPSTSPSSPDCTKAIYAMSDCIPFLSEGIQTTSPERSCCSGYETVVKSGPVCVCQSFEGTAAMGIRLNMTKAMTLSSACGIKNAPPLDNCNVPMPPGTAPAMSPKWGSPSPKSHPKFNIVPAPSVVKAPIQSPAPSPSSGAYSISAKLALTALNMLGAALLL